MLQSFEWLLWNWALWFIWSSLWYAKIVRGVLSFLCSVFVLTTISIFLLYQVFWDFKKADTTLFLMDKTHNFNTFLFISVISPPSSHSLFLPQGLNTEDVKGFNSACAPTFICSPLSLLSIQVNYFIQLSDFVRKWGQLLNWVQQGGGWGGQKHKDKE